MIDPGSQERSDTSWRKALTFEINKSAKCSPEHVENKDPVCRLRIAAAMNIRIIILTFSYCNNGIPRRSRFINKMEKLHG